MEIVFLEKKEFIFDSLDDIERIKGMLDANNLVIVRGLIAKQPLLDLRAYLHTVGTTSLPSYHHLTTGCPDHHRIIDEDGRAHVLSRMHIYLFFPWNQNLFRLFELCSDAFKLRNATSNILDANYLSRTPKDAYVPRLAVQHYPEYGGYLDKHSDPVWELQKYNISIQMSEFGQDFHSGGLFFETTNVDELTHIGDAALFPAQSPHGVHPISATPNKKLDWFSARGRWSLLPSYVSTDRNNSLTSKPM
jgi:hypothetical protein